MGKIKSKTIKKSAVTLVSEGVEFGENFEENKKILKNTMPSKKVRNQMAGYLVRIKKHERINALKMKKE